MTHVDQACPNVFQDLTTVFQSEELRNILDIISEKLGANPSNILPMQVNNVYLGWFIRVLIVFVAFLYNQYLWTMKVSISNMLTKAF